MVYPWETPDVRPAPKAGATVDGHVVIAENASPGFSALADTAFWPGLDASGPRYASAHVWHFADLYGWFVSYCGISQSAKPGTVGAVARACRMCESSPKARRRDRKPCD